MLSMLSSLNGFFSLFASLPTILGQLILALLCWPVSLLYIAVMGIAYFSEIVFKKLAGIDPIYLNGEQLTGASGDGKDLVYGFITDPAIQNVFWSIVALSIVLLFVCTLIALIKSEFTLELKGSAKGPIIGRAFKSLVNFLTVPVVTIIAILGTNFLTKSIYDMFGGEDATIVTKCFYVGAYNANRARIDENFAKVLSTGEYGYLESNTNEVFANGTNPFAGKSQKEVANLIDSLFINGSKIEGLKYNDINWIKEITDDAVILLDDVVEGNIELGTKLADINWALVVFDYPDENFSIIDTVSINFYYDLAKFDYVLSIGSAVAMSWLLLTVGMVLLKRVFELTILFLLAPAMTAIAPLDGGQAEKKWRGEFMKRLLAVIGPIFAYNMYFLMVPLFENIDLFGSWSEGWGYIKDVAGSVSAVGAGSMLGSIGNQFLSLFNVFDVFFQLVCVFVGLSIVKSASALLSSLLGIEDLVKSGSENAKKAVDIGKKTFNAAMSTALLTGRGTAAMYKMGKAGFKSIFNKDGKNSRKQAKEELAGAQDDFDNSKKSVTKSQEELADLEKSNIAAKENEYNKLQSDLEALTARKLRDPTIDSDNSKEKELKEKISDIKTGRYDEEKAKKYDDVAKENKTAIENFDKATVALDYRKSGISAAEQANIEKIEEEKKKVESDSSLTKEEKEEKVEELEKKKKSIFDNVDDSKFFASMARQYQTEFGKDSATESVFAKALESPLYKKLFENKVAQILAPTFTDSLKKWLNPDNSESNTVKRRMNDALAAMFGEGGGGELWKIWFNKNSRANLYEGLPESKKRTSKIEQSLSWGARDQYEQDKIRKQDMKKLEREVKRMLAQQIGGSFGKQYEELYNRMENSNNQAEIQKLEANIEKMEVKAGLSVKARNFIDEMTPGSAKAKQFADFKNQASDKANIDAARNQVSAKEKAFNATVAAKMDKPVVSEVKNRNGEPLKTRNDDKSSKKMGEDVAAGVRSAFEALAGIIEKSNDKLLDAISKLTGNTSNNNE